MSTATSNTWKVRHEGSPSAIDNLTPQEIAEGLADGLWETTDEVRGPDDAAWVPLENHPLFEEAAAEVEPAAPPHHDDSGIDMNPLIDVCLVLLVFFILTTSYAALQKRLEAPDLTPEGLPKVYSKDAPLTMIQVSITMVDGKPVTKIDDKVVKEENLQAEMLKRVGETQKSILLLQHDADAPHGAVVKVQAAAKVAGIQKILLPVSQR